MKPGCRRGHPEPMVWMRCLWVPLSLHPEAQGKQHIKYYLLGLRLGATQMHEAVAEIAIAREMTRLGATTHGRVDCRQIEPQTVPYCMRAQSGVALVKLIAWYYVNINMDTPSSPPRSTLGPEDARFPPASQTYSLHCVLPFRWLNCFQLLLLYYLPVACLLCVLPQGLSLPSECPPCGIPRQQL